MRPKTNSEDFVRTVLVTGASGFVGRALRTQLQSHGCVVRAVLRKRALVETSADMPDSESVQIGDIGPETDWADAMAGCSDVVHLAAHVHVMRRQAGDSASDFHRVNVEGSENLARQAARAGVRRFVFLSSVKVNGDISA